MRLCSFIHADQPCVGVLVDGELKGIAATEDAYPGDLDTAIAGGPDGLQRVAEVAARGRAYPIERVKFLPPLMRSNKILCVGLNYSDHTAETHYKQPDYPTLFTRFTTSLVAHGAPILRPAASQALDFEGELVAVIGRGGRHIPKHRALEHVIAYSLFNDGSVRDYQHRTPQWTVGKNFDQTGAFGPYLVTADELPPGARGLRLQTRLNGQVMQKSNTDLLIFDIPTLVATISEAITLQPGDLIVTGTPSGIGHSRDPKLYMKPGDIVEVEVEGIGVLRNSIADEPQFVLAAE